MKKIYQDLTKEEKQNNKDKFIKTEDGKNVMTRLSRVMIIGVLGIIVSIALFISAYVQHDTIWAYIYAVTIFVCSMFFVVSSPILKNKKLKNFYYKK